MLLLFVVVRAVVPVVAVVLVVGLTIASVECVAVVVG